MIRYRDKKKKIIKNCLLNFNSNENFFFNLAFVRLNCKAEILKIKIIKNQHIIKRNLEKDIENVILYFLISRNFGIIKQNYLIKELSPLYIHSSEMKAHCVHKQIYVGRQ